MATLVDEPVAVAGRAVGARVWEVGRSLPTLVLLAVSVARDATAAEPLAVGLADGLADAVGGRALGFGAAGALASAAVETIVAC